MLQRIGWRGGALQRCRLLVGDGHVGVLLAVGLLCGGVGGLRVVVIGDHAVLCCRAYCEQQCHESRSLIEGAQAVAEGDAVSVEYLCGLLLLAYQFHHAAVEVGREMRLCLSVLQGEYVPGTKATGAMAVETLCNEE